ncbi:MAG: DUF928 domain-containing protein [Leptolyngbyaceae bacterium]|nr:DUF928 domain-containing protein [Leptolyngbyaceae bacterium]
MSALKTNFSTYVSRKTLGTGLSLILLLTGGLFPALALQFPPTKGRGAPSRTVGGGTRDGSSCLASNKTSLTAIAPDNNIGTTATDNPTFFWYVPQTTATTAEFFMMDDQYQEVYLQAIDLPSKAGIVKIKLPPAVKLQPHKTYRWEFAVVCDPQDRTRDRLVNGWVERIPLNAQLQTRLTKASALDKAKLYAQASLWQETVALAAELRPQYPQEWEGLLKSVGLGAIAREPFIECCTPSASPQPSGI